MFELLRVAIALVGSVAAGFWDLKTTEIPDWVCLAMVAGGLSLFGAEGLLTGDWSGLTTSLAVGGAFLAFGLLMYFTGQWGGGDGELLVAMGVLLPAWPLGAKSMFPFPLALLINLFLVGAAYSIIYAVALAVRSPAMVRRFKGSTAADAWSIAALTAGTAVGAAAITVMFSLQPWLLLLPVLVAGAAVLYKLIKVVEQSFQSRIPARKLKTDDMLGEDIPELGLFKRRLRGLTAAEVRAIKRARKSVVIREGVRFGPVFPLALAVTLALGDLIAIILYL